MSSFDGGGQRARYIFKGRFGAILSTSYTVPEATHEEVDAFVRQILGLANNSKDGREETES